MMKKFFIVLLLGLLAFGLSAQDTAKDVVPEKSSYDVGDHYSTLVVETNNDLHKIVLDNVDQKSTDYTITTADLLWRGSPAETFGYETKDFKGVRDLPPETFKDLVLAQKEIIYWQKKYISLLKENLE